MSYELDEHSRLIELGQLQLAKGHLQDELDRINKRIDELERNES